MKRFLSFLLTLVLAVTVTACGSVKQTSSEVSGSSQNSSSAEEQNSSSVTENATDNTSSPSVGSGTSSAPANQSDSGLTVSTFSSTDENVVIEESQTPELNETVTVTTSHISVSSSDYYQYSCLSQTEKAIYRLLADAMKNTVNVVNVKAYGLHSEKASAIFEKVVADHPQYFWVARFMGIVSNSSDRVNYFILYYSDGTTVDNVDGNYKLTAMADRSVISAQISEFNQKVEDILKNISPALSDVEKERLIHDRLLKDLEYDYGSVNTTLTFGVAYPRAFDAYGALCQGKAVCEGYSKIFQYLCYCVGINSTTVIGTGNGGSHMWNTVKLDGSWYHVDVTWDDTASDITPFYKYFNLTESQMCAEDHTISMGNLNLPPA